VITGFEKKLYRLKAGLQTELQKKTQNRLDSCLRRNDETHKAGWIPACAGMTKHIRQAGCLPAQE